MRKDVESLLKNRKRYYSQKGEDGLLEFILSKIPEKTKWCVEFGAWDGKYLSNTFYFISKKNYKSVLIEGDPEKAQILSDNMKDYGSVCINKFVDFKGENTLDNILMTTAIPNDFDLLSIDIDGNDLQIWESLQNYMPKVVIIEINVRDKPNVERINNPNSGFVWGESGSSIKSMTELADKKGYSLLANISCNVIYIKKEYLKYFYDRPVTPDDVFLYEGHSFRELTSAEMRKIGWKKSFVRALKSFYPQK